MENNSDVISPTPDEWPFPVGTWVRLPAWYSLYKAVVVDQFRATATQQLLVVVDVTGDRGLLAVPAELLSWHVQHPNCPSCRCEPKPPRRRVSLARVELDEDEDEDEA